MVWLSEWVGMPHTEERMLLCANERVWHGTAKWLKNGRKMNNNYENNVVRKYTLIRGKRIHKYPWGPLLSAVGRMGKASPESVMCEPLLRGPQNVAAAGCWHDAGLSNLRPYVSKMAALQKFTDKKMGKERHLALTNEAGIKFLPRASNVISNFLHKVKRHCSLATPVSNRPWQLKGDPHPDYVWLVASGNSVKCLCPTNLDGGENSRERRRCVFSFLSVNAHLRWMTCASNKQLITLKFLNILNCWL